jgi:GT2 family glycosyltransferase
LGVRAVAIVLTWNGACWIEACLDSLLASDYPGLEILVVDNGSTDGTADRARAFGPRVRLIRNRRNLGFAEGNNIGMRAALRDGAELVALVNQDVRVEPDWLTRLAESADANPTFGILGPAQWDYDGRAPDPGFLAAVRAVDPQVAEAVAAGRRPAGPVVAPSVIGAALLLRRAVLERVGLFDPLYFAYFEEADLCRRARRAGFGVGIVPAARVYHWHGLAHPEAMSRRASYLSFRNQFLYELKDGGRAAGANVRAWLALVAREVRYCLAHPRGARGGLVRGSALVASQVWILASLPRIFAHRALERRAPAYW